MNFCIFTLARCIEYTTSEKENALFKNDLSADLVCTPKGGFIIVVILIFLGKISLEISRNSISAFIGNII
jgi:hypothetical protein